MVSARARRSSRHWPALLPAGVCALCGIAALAALLAGSSLSAMLPIGPLGRMRLSVDPLSAAFLTLFLLTTATIWSASSPGAAAMARAAAVCLAMVAGDPVTQALGVAGGIGRAGPVAAGILVVAGSLSTGLAGMALDLSGAVVVLLTGGVGAIPLGAYLLVRDLCGPGDGGAPAWWGLVPMVAGATMAVGEGWLATRSTLLPDIARHATSGASGLVVMAVGAAMLARGLDLGGVAAEALASTLLWSIAVTVAHATLVVANDTIATAAGTSVVFRLGGLIARMPVMVYAAVFAAVTLSALPPGPGFSAVWLLVQSLLALCRSGGSGVPAAVAVAALVAALGMGACALALWRLIAVALLGQPRTPRAAAAEPSPAAIDRALLAFAAALAVAGLLPGLAIRALSPAVVATLGPVAASGLAQRAGLFGLAAPDDVYGYSPLSVLALLAACATGVWVVARHSPRGQASAWADGFTSPLWLPFGEPGGQVSANAIGLWSALPLIRLPSFPTLRVRVSARRQMALLLGATLLALVAARFGPLR